MPFTYAWPHPAVTVDVIVFTLEKGRLKALLIQRDNPPGEGMWAIPGGFIEIDESLKRAAWRELREETGVHVAHLEQIGAFGHPDRDPRERIITVAYFALIAAEKLEIRADSDARDARLFPVNDLPELAFDHSKIMRRGLERLRQSFDDPRNAFELLPEAFTMSELQGLHEQILDTTFDKRNFAKKMLSGGFITPTGEQRRQGAHRPAALYCRASD